MVREALSLLALGSLLALPACAQPVPPMPTPALTGQTGQTEHAATPPDRCDAAAAQPLVGRKATRESLEQARLRAGARILRVVGRNDIVTQEFNASRLTVLLDEAGAIAEIRCG